MIAAGRGGWPWVAGGLGVVVGAWLVYQWATWPSMAPLSEHNPPTTAFIERYRSSQRERGRPDAVRWTWVSYDRISPHLKRAVVSAEDMEFFFHHGFSSAELKGVLTAALRKLKAPRGASTITQQLAKNLWLSPSRDPLRKLKEAILTKQLERRLTKRRILELYLNVAEFGPGIYGAEAAAQFYFGVPAADLTEYQAALLAASLPRPSTWHPGRDSEPYHRYAAEVQRRMAVATFLWRALGASPEAAMPEVAINVDSIVALLQDTLAAVADSDTVAVADTSSTALPDEDSLAAVSAAWAALAAADTGLAGLEPTVAGFTRDSAGYLIDLMPVATPDSVMRALGGVVRVGRDGTATIVQIRP